MVVITNVLLIGNPFYAFKMSHNTIQSITSYYDYSILKLFKSGTRHCLSRRLQYLLQLAKQDIKLCDTWLEEAESYKYYFQEYYVKNAKNLTKDCNSSCVQSQYIGQTIFLKGRTYRDNEIEISYEFPSNEVQIVEEYLMFGFNELIGTIGGHSGLFIGFSFYGFISTILEYIKSKF